MFCLPWSTSLARVPPSHCHERRPHNDTVYCGVNSGSSGTFRTFPLFSGLRRVVHISCGTMQLLAALA